MATTEEKVRIDKWLWAARFFKTRSLAAEAVTGGKAHLNGIRVKSSHTVSVGDEIVVTKEHFQFHIKVLGLSGKRGPASAAQTLYEEFPESIAKREETAFMRKEMNVGHAPPAKKPTKRDRRKIIEFVRKKDD